MVPSLLSVFTFYIIAAIAPADAKLQPRAVRQGAARTSGSLAIDPDRDAGVVWRHRSLHQDLVLGPAQPLESGGVWKACRRDATSFFATTS